MFFHQLQSHHQYPHVSKNYVLPGLNFCVLACLFVSCVFACLFVSVCPNVSTLSSCVTQCVPLKMNRLPPPRSPTCAPHPPPLPSCSQRGPLYNVVFSYFISTSFFRKQIFTNLPSSQKILYSL